jgi:hypothetical protein
VQPAAQLAAKPTVQPAQQPATRKDGEAAPPSSTPKDGAKHAKAQADENGKAVEEKSDPQKLFPRLARCFSMDNNFVQRFVALAIVVTSETQRVDYSHPSFVKVPALRRMVETMLTLKQCDRPSSSVLLQDSLFESNAVLDVQPTSLHLLRKAVLSVFGYSSLAGVEEEPLPAVPSSQ